MLDVMEFAEVSSSTDSPVQAHHTQAVVLTSLSNTLAVCVFRLARQSCRRCYPVWHPKRWSRAVAAVVSSNHCPATSAVVHNPTTSIASPTACEQPPNAK